MYDVYSRMELLLGQTGVDRLGRAQIAVFGLGGVGSYAVEALARCGRGKPYAGGSRCSICNKY